MLLLTHKQKEEQGTRTSKMSLFAPQLLNKTVIYLNFNKTSEIK